jgi:peptidoglycan/LPS O-acetylase OafA/YrhL
MTRVPELTGLRCVAVMMVVLGHAHDTAPDGYHGWLAPLSLLSSGAMGVQIFFVLSGFLITGILEAEFRSRERIDLWQFYLRRALRIWPAFYAFLIVLVVLSYAGLIDIAWQQFVFAATYTWNYSEMLGVGPVNNAHLEGAWYLGHFWSLALEEQFYWFWPPLLIFILLRKSEKLLPVLILVIPMVRVVSYFLAPGLRGQLGMMLHTGVDSILIGCYASLKREPLKAFLDSIKYRNLLVGLLFVLMLALPWVNLGRYWSNTYGTTVNAALMALIVVALTHLKDFWLCWLLRTRVFVFVGTISYSLYLWQQLFLHDASPATWGFPLNIVQSFAAATLSYWFIETPFLKLKDALHGLRRYAKPSRRDA